MKTRLCLIVSFVSLTLLWSTPADAGIRGKSYVVHGSGFAASGVSAGGFVWEDVWSFDFNGNGTGGYVFLNKVVTTFDTGLFSLSYSESDPTAQFIQVGNALYFYRVAVFVVPPFAAIVVQTGVGIEKP